MERWVLIDPDAHPDPDELDSLEETLDALEGVLPGPITKGHALTWDERGLSKSWLGQAFTKAKHLHGNHTFVNTGIWSRKRRLVATLNQLDMDVGEVLESEDPHVEATAVYRGLINLAEEVIEDEWGLSAPVYPKTGSARARDE